MIGSGERVSDPVGSGWVLTIALAFYVAACLLLAFTGQTLGTLHAFAAFIVIAVVAALNQLLPVLTHAPVARPQAVLIVAAGFAAGFILLIAAFYGASTFLPAAAVLAITAAAWCAWNAARLLAGHGEEQTRILMGCALVFFALAAAAGVTMAGTLGGAVTARLDTLAPVHAALAVVGFASLLILAISYRFVPMFSVAHATAYGRRALQWLAVACALSLPWFMRFELAVRLSLIGLSIVAIGVGRSHAITLRSRLRKRLDVSLCYGYVGWCFAILALLQAFASTWNQRFAVSAVACGILGWICITILGYAYKVAGFLAWQTAKNRDSSAQLPALSTAVNLRLAYAALWLLGAGVAATSLFFVARPEFARIGFDIYALGGLSACAALMQLATLYVFRENAHAGRVYTTR